MVKKKSCTGTMGFMLARVDELVVVNMDGRLDVEVTIEAENRTQEIIILNENYPFPMKYASNLEAYDLTNNKQLAVFFNARRRRIEVVFNEGTTLRPGQKFSCLVKYKTSRFGVRQENNEMITGVFALVPGKSYKQIPIQNHRVNLRMVFRRLKDGNSFKELDVFQCNNQNVPVTIKTRRDRVECSFDPFDLGVGSKLRVTFNYQHRSSAPLVASRTNQTPPFVQRFAGPVISIIVQTIPGVLAAFAKELVPFLFRRG